MAKETTYKSTTLFQLALIHFEHTMIYHDFSRRCYRLSESSFMLLIVFPAKRLIKSANIGMTKSALKLTFVANIMS